MEERALLAYTATRKLGTYNKNVYFTHLPGVGPRAEPCSCSHACSAPLKITAVISVCYRQTDRQSGCRLPLFPLRRYVPCTHMLCTLCKGYTFTALFITEGSQGRHSGMAGTWTLELMMQAYSATVGWACYHQALIKKIP